MCSSDLHVFARDEGSGAIDTPDKVLTRWEEIKAKERAADGKPAKKKTLLSGIAPTLPALLRAYEIGIRAKSVGFEWDTVSDVVDKIQEEVDEVREVVSGNQPLDHARAEEEMGDLLFTIVNLARKLGVEPESALRKTNDKFIRRFSRMEQHLAATGREIGRAHV